MGPGISYRDWVKRAEDSSDLELTLTSGDLTNIEHLKTKRLREIAIASSTSSNELQLEFTPGASKPNIWTGEEALTVGCVGLFNYITGGIDEINVEIKVYANGNIITPVYTSDDYVDLTEHSNKEHGVNNMLFVFNQEYTNVTLVKVRYYRLSGDIGDLGRLWVGNYMQSIFDKEWQISPDTKASVNYSKGNDAHTIFSRRKRKGFFPFSHLSYEEAFGSTGNVSNFNDLHQTAGRDSEIVICPRGGVVMPTTIYGLVNKDNGISHQGGNFFETTLNVSELI